MRPAARLSAALAAMAFLALATPPLHAAPGTLVLPKPVGEIPVVAEAFADRPERLRRSIVPGPVDDTERIDVLVGPTGAPAVVTMTQRLVLSGTGQFIIWERSSAQDAEALEDTIAPVLKREAVIWQGFVSGTKTLAAKLTLDPVVEATLLPIAVELEWRGDGELGAGGIVPGQGEVVVRLRNRTARGVELPTGDVDPALLAGPLDTLLTAGNSRVPGTRPAAGRGLPATLPARDLGQTRNVAVPAPLRVTGTIRIPGGGAVSPTSSAVTHLPDGIRLDGVLQGDAEFVVASSGPTVVTIDLRAFPTVDPRNVTPPTATTWRRWLAAKPDAAAARAATDALVTALAESARGADFAPYLGHHGPGKVTTTFHVSLAPASAVRAASKPLRPKAFPLALAGFALLGVVANGTAIWRRL